MPVNHFIEVLNSRIRLSAPYELFLRQHVHAVYAKAGHELLPVRHKKLVFFFVEKGMIYSWHEDHAGGQVPSHFASEDQFLATAMNPLYPTLILDGLSCVEDSVLITGDIAMTDEAIRTFPEARELVNLMVNEGQLLLQERHNALMLHDATERYHQMLKIAPGIFGRVPERLLAPYLNMSRGHFNYIKNKPYKGR